MTEPDVIPAGIELHDWDDVAGKRQALFDGVKTSLESQFPRSYGGVRMELHNSRYDGPEHYSIQDQKNALLDGKFLHRKLKGTVKLFDEMTGQSLDERDMTLMRVPFMTDRHTFIHNGSEYSTLNQARLLPGVYTRRKASGELESHFNAKRGSGPSFRIRLEPESGLFKLDIGQSSLRLYSLLRDLGVPDEQLEKSWGPELLNRNRDAYDVRVFEKAFARLVRRPKPDMTKEDKVQAVKDALNQTLLSRQVLERTLPNRFNTKLASEWRKQAFSNATSVSPTQAMKLGPRQTGPNLSDMLANTTANTDKIEDDSEERFNRADYLLLAQLLNKEFKSRIPMDLPYDQLVEAIEQAMSEVMPGVDKRMLAMAMSSKKQARESNSLGCLMAVLEPQEAAPILNWSKENLPADELALDGVEQMPHATVKYGFKAGFNHKRLTRLLKDFGPIRFTLQDITRFKDVQDGQADAIIVAVESPDLIRLNKLVEDEFSDSFDTSLSRRAYKPHLTLAYVKPGACKKLDGHAWFSGGTYVLKKLMFKSSGSKERFNIALTEG